MRPTGYPRKQAARLLRKNGCGTDLGPGMADLVAHGSNPSGDHCHTPGMVHVRTGWPEQVAVLYRAHLQARIEDSHDRLLDRTKRQPANRPPYRAGSTSTAGHGGSPPRRAQKRDGVTSSKAD